MEEDRYSLAYISNKLDVKYSTVKTIYYNYKDTGRIERKTYREPKEQESGKRFKCPEDEEKSSNGSTEEEEKSKKEVRSVGVQIDLGMNGKGYLLPPFPRDIPNIFSLPQIIKQPGFSLNSSQEADLSYPAESVRDNLLSISIDKYLLKDEMKRTNSPISGEATFHNPYIILPKTQGIHKVQKGETTEIKFDFSLYAQQINSNYSGLQKET